MLNLTLFYILLIIFFSLNPWIKVDSDTVIGFITQDMLAHAAAYGGLVVILLSVLIRSGSMLAITLFVIMGCGLGGVLMEYCQYWFTESRQLSLHDAVANLLGSILGAVAFCGTRYFCPTLLNRLIAPRYNHIK